MPIKQTKKTQAKIISWIKISHRDAHMAQCHQLSHLEPQVPFVLQRDAVIIIHFHCFDGYIANAWETHGDTGTQSPVSNKTAICIEDQPQFRMCCDRCEKGITDLY